MAKRSSEKTQREKTLIGQRESILGSHKLMAFIATTDLGRAREFYRDILGLHLVSEDQFALVFDAAGTMLRVTLVQQVAAGKYTVLGWQVTDIVRTAK